MPFQEGEPLPGSGGKGDLVQTGAELLGGPAPIPPGHLVTGGPEGLALVEALDLVHAGAPAQRTGQHLAHRRPVGQRAVQVENNQPDHRRAARRASMKAVLPPV